MADALWCRRDARGDRSSIPRRLFHVCAPAERRCRRFACRSRTGRLSRRPEVPRIARRGLAPSSARSRCRRGSGPVGARPPLRSKRRGPPRDRTPERPVGSRVGAVPACAKPVSNPRRLKPGVPVSSTGLSCPLHRKTYGSCHAGSAFETGEWGATHAAATRPLQHCFRRRRCATKVEDSAPYIRS